MDNINNIFKIISQSAKQELHKKLNTQKDKPAAEQKLLLLQIDGLSYPALKEAIDNGYTPNIKNILSSNNFTLKPYLCGLATMTMPVISSIFYGMEIPGNKWYSKEKQIIVDPSSNEEEIAKQAASSGNEGIMTNGTVFSSPFSGGSKENYFVLSDIKKKMQNGEKLKTLLEEAKKELPLLKKSGSLLMTGLQYLWDVRKIHKHLKKSGFYRTIDDIKTPFITSLKKNVFEKGGTEGVIEAIHNKKPIIYIDFASYDAFSHRFTTRSATSLKTLSKIDSQIGKILNTVNNESPDYKVFIFSDHGHVNSELFTDKFGKTLNEVIQDYVNKLNKAGKSNNTLKENEKVVFSDVHSMGNLYFNFDTKHVSLSRIQKKYPGLMTYLINHPGISLVAARQDKNIILKSKNGYMVANQSGKVLSQKGENPLSQYGNPEILLSQTIDYMKLKESGDMLVFSPYINNKVLNYNTSTAEPSIHGGFGGEQTQPFIIYDKNIPINPEKINIEKIQEAKELYHIFKNLK